MVVGATYGALETTHALIGLALSSVATLGTSATIEGTIVRSTYTDVSHQILQPQSLLYIALAMEEGYSNEMDAILLDRPQIVQMGYPKFRI